MRTLGAVLWLVAALIPSATQAAEFVVTSGPLSDDDFYRVVACGARPGGNCAAEFKRWSRQVVGNLTVSVVLADADFPAGKAQRVLAAIDAAIAEINGLATPVAMRLVEGPRAKIRVYLVVAADNGPISGTRNRNLDGRSIGAGYVNVNWQGRRVTSAEIAISSSIRDRDIGSVVLEELTQALGLLTDIRNPYYEGRSIFSEDDNSVARLSGQDLMVLRRHYPGR